MDAHRDDSAAQPDAWGIQWQWVDVRGQQVTISEETGRALRAVIGEPPADLEQTAPIVARRGDDLGPRLGPGSGPGLGTVEVDCEDGSSRGLDGVVPGDFPFGYHWLHGPAGRRRLIVSPGRCWLPDGWRTWGWTAQLYAARSSRSWGIGDLGDLRALREWSQADGAGFMLVNPLHAVTPTLPQEASPYLPATRRFRNPIYLAVESVPGAERVDLSQEVAAGRSLGNDPVIDRDRVWPLKLAALEKIFNSAEPGPDFEAWRAEQGQALEDFAVWSVLAEEHDGSWRQWDPTLHDPRSVAVTEFATRHGSRVTFHAWLQWLLDVQLRAATADLHVIQDLPIGVSGDGVDAWTWQDTIAADVTVGAPPDWFSTKGQDWGSPPLVPWRLRQQDYEPFIAGIRSTMAGAGGIRIDHVMGLFRLWWVPQEAADPRGGAYVRYPSRDLLDIVALESHRAQALVVGEDLGVVEEGVREVLAEHSILSYKLLWFEPDHPAQWPAGSLAAVTTHDLPTVAGVWSGTDLAEQAACTDVPEEDLARGREEMVSRLRSGPELGAADSDAEAVVAAHRLLACSPSILLSATLDDAVAEQRRPNIPGAAERDNWCLALPVLVDELPDHPVAAAVARSLRDRTG